MTDCELVSAAITQQWTDKVAPVGCCILNKKRKTFDSELGK